MTSHLLPAAPAGWLWSTHPGARERHLQRRWRNAMFEGGNEINALVVEAAQSEDRADSAQLRESILMLLEEVFNLPDVCPWLDALEIHPRIDALHARTFEVGGDWQDTRGRLRGAQIALFEAMKTASANDPSKKQALDQLILAIAGTHTLDDDFVAQVRTGAIPANDVVPALLCEALETVRLVASTLESKALSDLRVTALLMLTKADQAGLIVTDADEKIAALRFVGELKRLV